MSVCVLVYGSYLHTVRRWIGRAVSKSGSVGQIHYVCKVGNDFELSIGKCAHLCQCSLRLLVDTLFSFFHLSGLFSIHNDCIKEDGPIVLHKHREQIIHSKLISIAHFFFGWSQRLQLLLAISLYIIYWFECVYRSVREKLYSSDLQLMQSSLKWICTSIVPAKKIIQFCSCAIRLASLCSITRPLLSYYVRFSTHFCRWIHKDGRRRHYCE